MTTTTQAAAGGPCREFTRPALVLPRGRLDPAAVLVRLSRPRHRMGPPGIQPRAGDPGAVVLHVPARAEVHAAGDRPGRGSLAGRRADRGGAVHRAGRQHLAHRPPGVLRADHLDLRADHRRLRGEARLVLLAVGAAPRVHAAAAVFPLLQDQHQPAVRLLGDRRRLRAGARGAGLSRGQRHRPRGLQAAGGRGLLGPALPVPDHELLLRLRGALSRAGLAQAGASCSRRCRSRS